MERIYKAIDLFAGIGGIRLAFHNAFKEKLIFNFACEINKYACKTYIANFFHDPLGDITKLNNNDIPDFNILLAGFPCQSFSIAGEKRGFDDIRGTMFFHIAQILKERNPDAFLLENVKNLQFHDNGNTFKVIISILEELGYHVYYRILDAKDFGLPQHRQRIYIVGFRTPRKFSFPTPLTTPRITLSSILQPHVPTKYYLSQKYLDCLKAHRQHHEDKGHGFGYEVLNIERNDIANTLVLGGMGHEKNLIKDKDTTKNKEGIRKMTVREWARLQGFPDKFYFPVSDTQAYRQIANSVPIPVVEAIARNMKISLDNS
jgi:DNA (cytosine-5)-methyltransferase 1